jgi:hypothetical protein
MTNNDLYIQIKFLKTNNLSAADISKRLNLPLRRVYYFLNQLTREEFSTKAENVLYHSKEWKLMRELVLTRDGNKCVRCGAENSWKNALQVEHVLSKAYHPELAFEMSNLMTLCNRCHKKTKTFSRGAKKVGRKLP